MNYKIVQKLLKSPFFKCLSMLFYCCNDLVDPGEIALEILEKVIFQRFKMYCSSIDSAFENKELYYDKISHLFMSIIAIDYPYFKELFINGELKIFKNKLKNIKFTEIKNELSKLLQFLNKVEQNEIHKNYKLNHIRQINLFKNVIETLISKSVHVFNYSHTQSCKKFKMIMPFTLLLKLVGKREVEVKNGKVSMSCGKWMLLLEIVYEFTLHVELLMIEKWEPIRKAVYEFEDDRIRQIIKRFTEFLNGRNVKKEMDLKAEDIDTESQYFPPCMSNLHQILRKSHRLSYESRYQYTLFLKDIGLSIDENILFWENEYSKPFEGSSCIHDWEEKQNRYKYQIQHMYGLIGAQQPKKSHSCDKFTQPLQLKMDGACPFMHMGDETLKKKLPKSFMLLPDIEDIFKYKNSNMPQKACAAYLKCQESLLQKQTNNFNNSSIIYIVSPLQYYNIAKHIESVVKDC